MSARAALTAERMGGGGNVLLLLPYAHTEARNVARAIRYFVKNVDALQEDADRLNLIADAIEAQLRPPTPPEPQGLGAVVEASCVHNDTRQKWVRTGGGNWYASGQPDDFDSLRNVRVLSEGIEA